MDVEKAQQMMADAIKAMLECGAYQVAQSVATRTTVGGQTEDVMCLTFGRSADALDVIAARIGDASSDESVTFDAAKRAQLGNTIWRGDTPTHYHVRTPLPTWLTGDKD